MSAQWCILTPQCLTVYTVSSAVLELTWTEQEEQCLCGGIPSFLPPLLSSSFLLSYCFCF